MSRFEQAFLVLAGIFIASLVSCNLIFQKFFTWSPFGLYTFEISVGILPYPVTFLVTDVISEVYGKKRANAVVKAGFVASLFILVVLLVATKATPTAWSPVDDETFRTVFGLTGPAIFASMAAYLAAQFIDIRIYHFWKKLTGGRHLWLRNNGSTVISQVVDTSLVLFILCGASVIGWERFPALLLNGVLFKVLVALLDTPLLYLVVALFRRTFPGEMERLAATDPTAA